MNIDELLMRHERIRSLMNSKKQSVQKIKSEDSSRAHKTESASSQQGKVEYISETEHFRETYDSLKDLSNDFLSILGKGSFADITIKCGSGIMKAHKIVLCARSSVFEAMFTSPMKENKEGTVTIDDMNISVVRTMLDFMYSGQVKDLNLSTSCDLLYAAEKYQIKSLKRICVRYLRSHLTEEHAFNILQWADLYDKELKVDAISYINEKFSVLKVREDWKKLQSSNPALAVEVFSSIFDKLQTKELF